MAGKWNYARHAYDPYDLPDGASCYEVDMDETVACAECGKLLPYGLCYTSLVIHTDVGFGYAVCADCYGREVRAETEAREDD